MKLILIGASFIILVALIATCAVAGCREFKLIAYEAQFNYQTEQPQTYEPTSKLGHAMMRDVSRVIKKPLEKTSEKFASRRATDFANDWYDACNWGVYK